MFILSEIKNLLKSMKENDIQQEQIKFSYNSVKFDVIFLIDRIPYELLFGIVDHNYSFILKMYKGYQLENIPEKVFRDLCKILNLKAGKEGLTSFKFLKNFASKIPEKTSLKKIQPHVLAQYLKSEIEESKKIYFCGWRPHFKDKKRVRNLEKTRKLLGEKIYQYCDKNNISSCWTAEEGKRKDFFSPK